MADSVLGYLDGIFIAVFGIDGHTDLLGEHLELVDGGGTVYVACHEQRTLALLRLELACELAGKCCLTRALQTRHEDDGGIAREVDLGSVASHEAGELVMDYLDHEFARLDGVDYVLTHRLGLDFVGKLFGYLEVYVGLEECATHVLESLGDIDFGNLAFAFKYLEAPFEPFA